MNILVAGSGYNASLLAQYLKQSEAQNDIYITDDKVYEDSGVISINIKENDTKSISDFVKYNQIEFTIAASPLPIINGISDELRKEGFLVFAPLAESARITYLNSVAKKILYKLKINTPKFGIFDRENLAVDYVRNSRFPLTILNDLAFVQNPNNTYKSFSKAKEGIQKIFENGNEKIIIENYIDSEPVYLYFITDGYNALPLINLQRNENKDFTVIKSPCEKISEGLLINILNKVIYPLLDDIKAYSGSYTGIIGLKIKLYRNNFYILEFYNSFQSYDMQAFLSLFNDDLTQLMINAAKGELKENYIEPSGMYSYTVAINKKELTKVSEDIYDNLSVSEDENNYIITSCAPTMNSAKEKLYKELENIFSDNILKNIKKNESEKEYRY